MERRDFVKATLAGAATAITRSAYAQIVDQTSQGGQIMPTGPVTSKIPEHPDMKYRPLGITGERVSLIGLGGFHLAKPGGATADEAIRIVHAALDAGVNFCDNCWDYNGGESEVRLGRALAGGRRDKTFLMTKIDGRTATAAMRQLEESLTRLQTDHLDLLQFHEIIRMDDPEKVFAKDGALEAVLKAREQGKLRYIGFTGHKSPAIHRHMFEVAAANGFHFDTVQMPLNVMDAHYDSFEANVLPIALQHGTGVLGMKAFGDPFILESNVATPIEMLQYPMSLPISLQVTGIDSLRILQQALEAVRTFKPLTQDQRNALLARTASVAATGDTERYKTSHHFDGTIQNPQWLG
jgi:diketogulonate reductase-like aldo/keto reductase